MQMTKATRARYTLEFKQEAVRLVESGQSIAAASRTLGLVEQTLFNWVKAHRGGTLKGAESRSKVTAEQISVIDPARSAVGAVRFLWMMPALFMSTSSLGNPIFTRVASVAICAGCATSLWIVWSFGASYLHRPVLTRADRSHYLVSKFDEFEREARPMPAEPPVIRMVRPLRIIKFLSGVSFEVKSKTWCVSS
jgi:transposase